MIHPRGPHPYLVDSCFASSHNTHTAMPRTTTSNRRFLLALACWITWLIPVNGQEEGRQGHSPTIKITKEKLCPGKINPYQYGQFVEYLCNLVPGMWAEKIYDGSFEGLSPYKVAFLKETDFREKPWYPSGAVNRADYERDPHNPVSGAVCQRIAAGPGAPCTVGISQNGIAIQRGKACNFSCYLRQTGLHQ